MLTLPSPREKKHAFNHAVHWPSRAEAKRVRCARSKRFISNVSACQITIVRVQHPLRGSAYLRGKKHRTQASTKKKKRRFNAHPRATNAGGSQKSVAKTLSSDRSPARAFHGSVLVRSRSLHAPPLIPPSMRAFHEQLSARVTSANSWIFRRVFEGMKCWNTVW